MDFDELVDQWTGSMENGTFLTPKHDPNNLSTTYASYRTVLTPQMSSSLETFIRSRNFEINVYQDNKHKNYYCEIISTDPNYHQVANGVPSGSNQTGSLVDKLVIYSGSNQGWHIIGEDSVKINQKVKNCTLTFYKLLKQ